MRDSDSDLSQRQTVRLRRRLLEMPMHMLYKFADIYDVEIPFDAEDNYTIVKSFLDDLSLEGKKELLSQYGDAGKVSSYIFISREKTPPIQNVYSKARALLEIESESRFFEKYPYFDEVEIDDLTRTLRIRFHYLLGSVSLIDEETGISKEHRRSWRGVVVYRPESRFLEIRTKYRSMARRLSAGIPAYLGLEPFYSFNLMDAEMNMRFVDWISSLNSATIELSISEVSGSLTITARKGLDLRTAKRYHEELKYGRLRQGHVTIEPEKDHNINFHIYFRDCHTWHTLVSNEEDIGYILDALEKISEGYTFAKPEKLLTEFFGKKA